MGSSIWSIPFPAITVCNNFQIKPTVFNYSDKLIKENLSDDELVKFHKTN